MKLCGREELITDPGWATPAARLPKIPECFALIEQWTLTKTKMESWRIERGRRAVRADPLDEGHLRGPVALRARHAGRARPPDPRRYVQVGSPINLSDSPVEHQRAPLLGEHTDEVLKWLGHSEAEIASMRQEGAV